MTRKTRQTEHSTKRFFSSRLFLIVLLVCTLLIAISYARAYYQDYAVRQEIARLQQEVGNLEHKKLESFELLKYVSSDAYVEEKARVEFDLKKPGEQVLVIEGDTMQASDVPVVEDRSVPSTLKNPAKWWYYITHTELPNT